MKRLLTLLLSLLLVFSLVGCNSKETVKVEEPTVKEETTESVKEEEKEEVVEEVKEEAVEEVKEEVKEEKAKDITKMKFWVVFFNQDGSELYRTAIKYGTVPSYEGSTPYYSDGEYWYYFVGWTDKYGRDVNEFKPITGNTRFYAKYEIGGKNIPTPAPTPQPGCQKNTAYLVYCNNEGYQYDIDIFEYFEGEYYFIANRSDLLCTKFGGSLSAGRWSHTDDDPRNDNAFFTYCDDYESHSIDFCFVAGTQVQYDLLGHTKNIEDFKVGDQIVSYNVNTNKYYLAKVAKVFVHDGSERTCELADVALEDGSVITMTPNHPVLTTAGFKAIDNNKKPELKVGQFVMTANGWTQIKKINVYDCEPTATYNLNTIDYDEIVDNDSLDTYIAGGIVVHNIK